MKVSLLFADVGSGMCSCQNGEKKAKEHVKSKIRDNMVHNTEMADICENKQTNKQNIILENMLKKTGNKGCFQD